MRNKFVVELTIETDQNLTKKSVREFLTKALSETELVLGPKPGVVSTFRIRSIDKD